VIGSLRGRISAKAPPQLTVEVGGVGYELEAPMSTFFQLPPVGAEVHLLTHLVVREDAHVLFGFGSEEERRLFRSLIKVSGVGPKIALALLSGISVADFHQHVQSQDIGALTRVPGIGRKTAERLLLELRDRLQSIAESSAAGAGQSAAEDALNALVALGYSVKEARAALGRLDPALAAPDAIRQALKLLSKVA